MQGSDLLEETQRVMGLPATDWERAPGSVNELEERLSRPDGRVMRALERSRGDVIVLGAGGKMGPSLCRMLQRAADDLGDGRQIVAVSRFGGRGDATLAHEGVPGSELIRALSCDLTDARAIERLPAAPNVIFMAGQKFGTEGDPAGTWAMNTAVPALVANRYRESRMVCFSTGNVYALTEPGTGGSVETDEPAPAGDYAWSCLGRERIFTHYSSGFGTPVALVRLNYAVDLRYGVLVDIAARVVRGEPIDLSMGFVNVIWQGDANSYAIAALPHCGSPPAIMNVTGRKILRVRDVAERFGKLLGRAPVLKGREAATSLLSSSARARALLGEPSVPEELLIEWVAQWLQRGGELLGRPTHFEVRDGRY